MQLRSSVIAAAFAALAFGNPIEERASKPKTCPSVKRNAHVRMRNGLYECFDVFHD